MPDSPKLSDAPPEIHDRIKHLIAAYHPQLANAVIKLQMRDKAPTRSGASVWGEADTANNPSQEQQYDFTIWFAADAWALLDETQRDALAEHELFHCSWGADGKPFLRPHDIEEFNDIIARYGIWWPDGQGTLEALAVMPTSGPAQPAQKGSNTMPQGYQRPAQGNHGSVGAFQMAQQGNHGSVGAFQNAAQGNHGSVGADQQGAAVWTDPDLQPGDDFYTLDLGGGRHIELSAASYQAAVASIMADQSAGV